MRILTEASGSLVAPYMINAIRDAGHTAIGSDIDTDNAGPYLCDEFVVFPRKNEPDLWDRIEKILIEHNIDIVIPSFDEMLTGWSERQRHLKSLGVEVILSPSETIWICQDKWNTYQFFKETGIPCPATSLQQHYPLVKPRQGRGAEGICLPEKPIDMTGMISQEIARGTEYTVDCFFDRNGQPVYIVPRKRIGVQSGKATRGEVCSHPGISELIVIMSRALRFVGPINFQCFVEGSTISFIEINPRIAGGMALGFAATENWVNLIVDNLINARPLVPKKIQYGMKMVRYYAEYFIP